MSTLIAGMGLIQNSAAVVIGAMLVAPLMTPLVGIGLSLAQGNIVLIRHAVRSVTFGFLLAFTIGLFLGQVVPGGLGVPGVRISHELLARTSPNVLDLIIAFVSGLAAAYATARPNLLGALPGVAIAAALVPPIATSGITLAHGRPALAAGAALLFATNMVAIILGAAVSLFAIGIAAGHAHRRHKAWIGRGVTGLLVIAAVLAITLGYVLYAKLPSSRVPPAVRDAIVLHVQSKGVGRVAAVRAVESSGPLTLRVTLISSELPPADLAEELAHVAGRRYDQPVKIRLQTRLETVFEAKDR